MLSAQRRIPRDLFPMLKKAKVFGEGIISARVLDHNNKHSRFSVSVSKKVAKSAVARTRLRRMTYRSIAENEKITNIPIMVQIIWKKMPKNKEEADLAIRSISDKISRR